MVLFFIPAIMEPKANYYKTSKLEVNPSPDLFILGQ